jgi:Protein of unknown function (DUF3102)
MAEPSKPEQNLVSAGGVAADPMAELIKSINEAHNEVRLSLKRTGECAIKAGLLLLQAKRLVRHGSFTEWVAEHCTFADRTAQLYMQLARRFPNPQEIAGLSLTDLIQMLGPAKLPELKIDPPTKNAPVDPVAKAIKKSSALAVLQRAWEETNDTERKLFLSRVRAA